jgi:hypothetical protein
MFIVFSTMLSILLCTSIIYFMAINLYRARKALVSTTVVILRAKEYGLLAEIKKDIEMRLKPELVNDR